MGIDISKQTYYSDAMPTEFYSEEVPQVSYRKTCALPQQDMALMQNFN